MEYMLERQEVYIVPEAQLKNRTCQTTRWKQVAMSDDLEALKEIMGKNHRIINRELNMVAKGQNIPWSR